MLNIKMVNPRSAQRLSCLRCICWTEFAIRSLSWPNWCTIILCLSSRLLSTRIDSWRKWSEPPSTKQSSYLSAGAFQPGSLLFIICSLIVINSRLQLLLITYYQYNIIERWAELHANIAADCNIPVECHPMWGGVRTLKRQDGPSGNTQHF